MNIPSSLKELKQLNYSQIEELNKHYIDVAHHYEKVQYYPYGIITDIKEVKID